MRTVILSTNYENGKFIFGVAAHEGGHPHHEQ